MSAASASAMAKRASSQRALSSLVSRVESARAKAIAKARDDKPTKKKQKKKHQKKKRRRDDAEVVAAPSTIRDKGGQIGGRV